ncbi:MAG: aldose epimerase family protein [Bacteroidota bacterium]
MFVLILATPWIFSCQRSVSQQQKDHLDELVMPAASAFQGENGSDLFILEHEAGIKAAVTNYGGRLVSLWVKDRDGKWRDIVLGFDNLSQFEEVSERYYGATIGRYGNRIANGSFQLNGTTYQVPQNNGLNTLHGGPEGFHEQIWEAMQKEPHALTLQYRSPDGEMGFPGSLVTSVEYTLTDDPGLHISYFAKTDKPTVVNLTNHAFFNLNGEGSGPINDHVLMIPAEHYTPVDSALIPLGVIEPVQGTPFDFRTPKRIGRDIEQDHIQLIHGKGYDHNFVIERESSNAMHLSARIHGEQSGIQMEIYSQEPGVQLYVGNFLDGSHKGKSGKPYAYRTAFCLETQHFPDSPNQPDFPSTVLLPSQSYHTQTLHRFSIFSKEK